jgi:hypothetical protein
MRAMLPSNLVLVLTNAPGKRLAASPYVCDRVPRSKYRYSAFSDRFGVTIYSSPPPAVQPVNVEVEVSTPQKFGQSVVFEP